MATKDESRPKLKDSELAVEMLKQRLVGEAQLKAAIDYQESVGGKLTDILLKLGLVKEPPLRRFLDCLATGKKFLPDGEHELEIDVEKLQVHRKLVEKVPPEVVSELGILLFFPQNGSRAILLSTSHGIDERLATRLQKLLGVEVRSIELDPEVRRRFLRDSNESATTASSEKASSSEKSTDRSKPGKRARAAQGRRESVETEDLEESTEPEPPTTAANDVEEEPERPSGYEGRRRPAQETMANSDDMHLVLAVANLLVKKGVFTKDELKVELEFARRNSG